MMHRTTGADVVRVPSTASKTRVRMLLLETDALWVS